MTNVKNPNQAKSIGQRLKQYRILARLTQRQITEILEIDEQYYGQAERGSKSLGLKKLICFCSYFHIKLDDLVKIEPGKEGSSMKTASIEKITLQLKACSLEQLMWIQRVLAIIQVL